MELSGTDDKVSSPRSDRSAGTQPGTDIPPPPPVMTVNKEQVQDVSVEPQNLLMQFDELTHDLQVK